MGLTLPWDIGKLRGKVSPQESVCPQLMGILAPPQPKEVKMIRHQCVNRRHHFIAAARMTEDFPESLVREVSIEKNSPVNGCVRPENACSTAIKLLG